MATLSKPDLDRFLQESAVLAILGTLDGHGRPYLVPVWYEWDGVHLWIVSKPRAEYVKNLERDPHASVCIARPQLPYVRVLMQGCANLIPTEQEWLPMGHRLAERYLGKQEGDAYIDKTKSWKRVFIRLKPDRIISWDGGASGHAWGKKYIERAPSRPTRRG